MIAIVRVFIKFKNGKPTGEKTEEIIGYSDEEIDYSDIAKEILAGMKRDFLKGGGQT